MTTSAAAFGGARIARNLEPLLRPLPVVGGHNADAVALVIVVVLISFLSLVLGELVPKSLALRRSERYALLVAKPLAVLSRIARPIVWLLTATSNLVLRPFSDRTNFSESRISKEELEQMVDEAAKTGAIHEHASELASRALDFDRLVLHDVMLPRARIEALPMKATMDQIRRFMLEDRRSRIPVYDRSLDDILGYVSAKDIVSLAWDGGPVVLADLLRNVHFFPETRVGHRGAAVHAERAAAHRDRGRRARGGVGHGHVRGPGRGAGGRHLQRARRRRRAIDARARRRGGRRAATWPIRDVNRELGTELEEPPGVTTMAGLCIALAGGIPNRNARLAAGDGSVLVVLEVSARTVKRVRVVPRVTNDPAPA